MLKLRIATGVVLSCLLAACLFVLPPRDTVLAFGVVGTIGAWEWARFGALARAPARLAYACGMALLFLVSWRWTSEPAHLLMLLSIACVWWAVALCWLALAPERQPAQLALLCGVPVLVPTFVSLARLQISGHGAVRGPQLVLWLLLVVIAADIGAYFAGRSLGRHKMAPRVSPGKTWEGAGGGLLAVMLVAWGGAAHFGLAVLPCVAFGCLVGVFSVVGDLTESMFKRSAGLKDSGTLLPGHGGVLDRIDSMTAAAPLYALGLFGSGAIA